MIRRLPAGAASKLGVWILALLAMLLPGLAGGENTLHSLPVTSLVVPAAPALPFPSTFVDHGAWLGILRRVEGAGFAAVDQSSGSTLQTSPAGREPGKGDGPESLPAGGVVPHHLLAAPMIAEFFREMGRVQPQRVVVLGPNHRGLGAPVITADRFWDTPAGLVPVDTAAIPLLVAAGVGVDNEVMQAEHSIGNLMPFVAYSLPEASVIPLVIRGGMPLVRLRQLATALEPLLDDRTVVVASVDFSHYLPPYEAGLKDRVTLAAMQRRDLPALLAMGNDHLDSPPALVALFLLMEQRGRSEFVLTGHANSGDFLQSESLASTSYFTLLF